MIKLKKVYKKYNDIVILEDINIDIKQNEFILLDGVSGSGKSTILSIIAGILKPTSGEVLYMGENIVSYSDYFLSDYRQNIVSFIPQNFYFFENLTLKENISIPLHVKDINYKEIEKKVTYLLDKYQLLKYQNIKISALSGGQRQRAVIVRALVNDAKIILCDEPTSNLDKKNKDIFLEILLKLKEEGKTLVVASHDSSFYNLDFIDKDIKIDDGKIVE